MSYHAMNYTEDEKNNVRSIRKQNGKSLLRKLLMGSYILLLTGILAFAVLFIIMILI